MQQKSRQNKAKAAVLALGGKSEGTKETYSFLLTLLLLMHNFVLQKVTFMIPGHYRHGWLLGQTPTRCA